jgi:MFS family permease
MAATSSLHTLLARHLPFSPTTTPLQATTYLLFVSLSSIAFLVFLNAALSFVITARLGVVEGVGNLVGTLGFVDELVAIVACPLAGALSDRIGVRWVCVVGFGGVAGGLVAVVSVGSVVPGLVAARVLFSLGGAAT